jgi:hypothetical protein
VFSRPIEVVVLNAWVTARARANQSTACLNQAFFTAQAKAAKPAATITFQRLSS